MQPNLLEGVVAVLDGDKDVDDFIEERKEREVPKSAKAAPPKDKF